jgi:hypothetical protein
MFRLRRPDDESVVSARLGQPGGGSRFTSQAVLVCLDAHLGARLQAGRPLVARRGIWPLAAGAGVD